MLNATVRRKLAFIEKHLAPAVRTSPGDMRSPREVARLLRESADLLEMEQTADAEELTAMLSRHSEAARAARLSGKAPKAIAPALAEAAALAAAELDGDDSIDY